MFRERSSHAGIERKVLLERINGGTGMITFNLLRLGWQRRFVGACRHTTTEKHCQQHRAE